MFSKFSNRTRSEVSDDDQKEIEDLRTELRVLKIQHAEDKDALNEKIKILEFELSSHMQNDARVSSNQPAAESIWSGAFDITCSSPQKATKKIVLDDSELTFYMMTDLCVHFDVWQQYYKQKTGYKIYYVL